MLATIKRALGLSQSEETIGSVVDWAGHRLPMYYIPCDGRELTVGQNQWVKLYSVIGIKFGGDGQKTFKVPDLRPRDAKGNLVNPTDPWNGIPMKLICYEGNYPVFD